MILTLTPVRMDATLEASVAGDVLTLNGEDFDFGALPEGASLPRGAVSSHWFAGDVRREKGAVHVVLICPHGPHARHEALYPANVSVASGPVTLPGFHKDAVHEEH